MTAKEIRRRLRRGICLLLPLFCSAKAAAPLVFVLAGQSNMAGSARNDHLPASYSVPPANVFVYYAQYQALNGQPNNVILPLNAGFGNDATLFGPELGFGFELAKMYPGRQIYIIKFAVGATYLCNENVSGRPSWFAANGIHPDRELFPILVQTVQGGLSAIRSKLGLSANPPIDGFVWMQGESDGLASLSDVDGNLCHTHYKSNFIQFMSAFKSRTGLSSFNIIQGQLGSIKNIGSEETLQYLKNEQLGIKDYFNTQPGNPAALVCTSDLSMLSQRDDGTIDPMGCPVGITCHRIHYDEPGSLKLGARFARAFNKQYDFCDYLPVSTPSM
jgi:hypothetical protein